MSVPKVYRRVNPEWVSAWAAAHGIYIKGSVPIKFDGDFSTPTPYI